MLKDDLHSNEFLQKIFTYRSVFNSEAFNTQLNYLLNEPRFDGQIEIVEKIEWLCFVNNDNYSLIGLLNNDLWYMDEDGDLYEAKFPLQELPFKIRPDLSNKNHWRWETRKEVAKAFIYYFDYCEKNNIKLLPENLSWKEPLLKFLDQHNID